MRDFALILVCLIVLAIMGVLGFQWWTGQGAANRLSRAEKQAGTATVDAAAAKASADSARLLAASQAQQTRTVVIRDQNRAAILQTPGASDRLDPRLIDTVNRGLCEYAAARDEPGCVPLRPRPPGELPPAGEGAGAALP